MVPALVMLALLAPQDVPMPDAPTARDLAAWMAAIEPDRVESAYQAIPWRNELGPAIEEARALGRPILLWTMNGHPLGCT
jgi:hypothetical protein